MVDQKKSGSIINGQRCDVQFFVNAFLFFFHGYGLGGTRSHASHAEDAVICSDGNRFLSVWVFSKVLKFEDVDRANIHADTVAVALVPVNCNRYHFIYLSLEVMQHIGDLYFTLHACFWRFFCLASKRFVTRL